MSSEKLAACSQELYSPDIALTILIQLSVTQYLLINWTRE